MNFLAASNGKSLCDGIAVDVKEIDAAESLTRPHANQILTARGMLDFCVKNIPNITFKFIAAEELQNIRREHEKDTNIELILFQNPSLTIN